MNLQRKSIGVLTTWVLISFFFILFQIWTTSFCYVSQPRRIILTRFSRLFFIDVFTVHEQHHSPRFVIRLLRVLFAHSTQQYQNDGNKIIIIFDESNPQKHESILFYMVRIAAWKRIIHQHNIILLIFSTLF